MDNTATQPQQQPTGEAREKVISITGLAKSFNGKVVLDNINMELFRGENLVILGRSGQGKSVAIKCLVGLLQPDAGKLQVFGKDIGSMNDAELKEMRSRIGFLFQGGALYDSLSVRENLEFPLKRIKGIRKKAELDTLVMEMLESVGLPEAVEKMPSELSGGMRKRIGLARSMILKPEIMMYDEPTTGLDPITSREISELMLSIQATYKTSSVIITHDMACARRTANRIVVMNGGTFVVSGTYDELEHSNDALISSFFK